MYIFSKGRVVFLFYGKTMVSFFTVSMYFDSVGFVTMIFVSFIDEMVIT